MKNKFIIAFLIILIVIISFLYYRDHNDLLIKNKKLVEVNTNLSKELIKEKENNSNLIKANNEEDTKLYNIVNNYLNYIEPLKETNKEDYLKIYMNIMNDSIDTPENIFDYANCSEYQLLCQVVQAESGICDFNGKVNVATTIINRYFSETYPNSWTELLLEKHNGVYQYSCIGNGSYKNQEITEETQLAIDWAFIFGSDLIDDATYYHAGESEWHENNLVFVAQDNYHKFYKTKEE